jgi:hypothetical protein
MQKRLQQYVRQFRITAILGPRQCGKTTLARGLKATMDRRFDLEDPVDVARLKNARLTLERLRGLVVIDEIQRMPELFPLLRVLADRTSNPARFVILGSADPALIRGASESLAGRIGFVDVAGFDLTEVGPEAVDTLWLRGGFPESFLSVSNQASFRWRDGFIRTFLTRDIPQLGITIPAEHLRRFWLMLAHYHGQVWNASEIGASLGINYKTSQYYLDILTGAFLIRQLQPWTENLGKRVRKAPKIYFRDSGLLHSLLGISTMPMLEGHPKLGPSWEGLMVEQVATVLNLHQDEMFYWAVHSGPEIDLFFLHRGKRIGIEMKYSDAPARTRSMATAVELLRLDRLLVLYPGRKTYPLDERTTVIPASRIAELDKLIL